MPLTDIKVKVYTAILSQAGTNPPVVNQLLQNTLDGIIIWTRDAPGVYTGTLNNTFTNKTWIAKPQNGLSADENGFFVDIIKINEDTIQIYTDADGLGTFQDDILTNCCIEIKIYNI